MLHNQEVTASSWQSQKHTQSSSFYAVFFKMFYFAYFTEVISRSLLGGYIENKLLTMQNSLTKWNPMTAWSSQCYYIKSVSLAWIGNWLDSCLLTSIKYTYANACTHTHNTTHTTNKQHLYIQHTHPAYTLNIVPHIYTYICIQRHIDTTTCTHHVQHTTYVIEAHIVHKHPEHTPNINRHNWHIPYTHNHIFQRGSFLFNSLPLLWWYSFLRSIFYYITFRPFISNSTFISASSWCLNAIGWSSF